MSNHPQVYDHVLTTLLQNDVTFATNSFEALKTVEIIERIYKAAQKMEVE